MEGHNALIDNAKNIYVVELASTQKAHPRIEYSLRVVEVIKGKKAKIAKIERFISHSEKHHANHFDYHRNENFWKENLGRSPFPVGLCGPDHTFRAAELYLYFPDRLGAMKSAEIIKDKTDRWFRYVVEHVAANKSLQTDR
jgi:hypothetical protein